MRTERVETKAQEKEIMRRREPGVLLSHLADIPSEVELAADGFAARRI
jgi:hypothetical protein